MTSQQFTHIVLFKLRERSTENIAETARVLRSMAGKIPSLCHLEIGLNEIPSGRAYDLALIARFDDQAGMEAYQVHPVHQQVLAHIHRVAESVIAVDYHDG